MFIGFFYSQVGDREYRPVVNIPNCIVDCKLLKPQNCLEMLAHGTRDLCFGGLDWVTNLGIQDDIVEVLDTELDPVRIIAASPNATILADAKASGRHVVIASEYEKVTRDWIQSSGLNASFVRAFGATESFPPDDADIIVDNTATGSTLKANGLHIVDTLFHSSTRMFANKKTMEDPSKKRVIEQLVLLMKGVLAGRNHMLIEFNIESNKVPNLFPNIVFLCLY
jgi:ATP phosphoribosyltransferase